MAKLYIHTMSIYGIRQLSAGCHGNIFITVVKVFTSSVLLTASVKQILASRL